MDASIHRRVSIICEVEHSIKLGQFFTVLFQSNFDFSSLERGQTNRVMVSDALQYFYGLQFGRAARGIHAIADSFEIFARTWKNEILYAKW